MSWKFIARQAARCRDLAAQNEACDGLITDAWGLLQDAQGEIVAFGPFLSGRFLMNEELLPGALLRLYPTAQATLPLAPPAAFFTDLASQVPDAAILFVDGPRLDHRAMVAAGLARWFTHAGQAILRRDQIAPAMEKKIRHREPFAHLSDAWPTPEQLDTLYTNYCTLTGLLPRLRRSLDWWQRLLKRTDIRLQAIQLPTYDEDNPEALTGPLDTSGYAIFRDEGNTRVLLETVVSVIDGDEDENIDMLLNDTLHALVANAFWPADTANAANSANAAGNAQPLDRLIWHGSPGDLLWSRTSMYGCETREQTGTSYLKILKPEVIAPQLIKPVVEQDTTGDFEGEITVDLTDLEKIAFRRKGNRKAGRLTVRMTTQEFVACMLHPYRLTSLVAEDGIEFDCDDPDTDPMWVVFTSLFDVLHPHWPVLE